jgi:dephospho-CoA kinase
VKLGLTGGIGCGKSTAVRMLADLGWRTLQADAIGHAIVDADPLVRDALLARWGNAVLDSCGRVSRQWIATRVFRDDEELQWLEQLLHPRIRAEWEQRVSANAEANWVVEIPLLFEKRLETAFDFTVCVVCPLSTAKERIHQGGDVVAAFDQRRRRQLPLELKAACADYVIYNAGSLNFLQRQIEDLIQKLSAVHECL